MTEYRWSPAMGEWYPWIDWSPMLYRVNWTFFSFTVLVFACRWYSRAIIKKRQQAYDWIMLAAFADIVAMHALVHMQIKTGMGLHSHWSADHPDEYILSLKVGYAENVCYTTSLFMIKLSILMQYLAIWPSPTVRRWVYAILAFVVLYSSFTILGAILLCLPISNTWNLETFPEGCWNTAVVNTINSSVNIATDLAIYIVPIPILIKLTIPKRKKLGLLFVFSVAFMAIGATIGRLTALGYWNDGSFTSADQTKIAIRNGSLIPVWGAVEADCGLMAVSLPLIQPLYRLLRQKGLPLPRLFTSSGNNSDGPWAKWYFRRPSSDRPSGHAETASPPQGHDPYSLPSQTDTVNIPANTEASVRPTTSEEKVSGSSTTKLSSDGNVV